MLNYQRKLKFIFKHVGSNTLWFTTFPMFSLGTNRELFKYETIPSFQIIWNIQCQKGTIICTLSLKWKSGKLIVIATESLCFSKNERNNVCLFLQWMNTDAAEQQLLAVLLLFISSVPAGPIKHSLYHLLIELPLCFCLSCMAVRNPHIPVHEKGFTRSVFSARRRLWFVLGVTWGWWAIYILML